MKVIARTDKGRRVLQRIFADRPQCVAVVGDPRIGKTSFLAWLAETSAAEAPPRTSFVSLALRDNALPNPDALLRAIVEAVPGPDGQAGRVSSVPATPDGTSRAYAAFEALVQRVAADSGRLVVLMDDFDCVTRSPDFPLPFFSFLRSLANNFPVAYVTSSRLDLQQLCALKEVEESPFFNIFQNVTLGPLDEAQSLALAAERTAAPADGPAAAWAWSESGGLPAVILACAQLAPQLVPGSPEATEALDAAVAGYFEELWTHLDAPHRALMERLARGEAPGEREARPLRDLAQRRGYLRELDGRWQVLSQAFGRFVASRAGADSHPGLFTRLGRILRGPGGPR
jgi:eukaryotic-like serine/threonine-protein kinase